MCNVVISPSISIVEDASSAQYHIDLTYISFQPLMQWTVPWEVRFIGTDGILAQAFFSPAVRTVPKAMESEQEVQRG